METNIQLFKNERFGEVRVTEIEGKIYFLGSDVAKALGYSNPHDAIIRHCKLDGFVNHDIIDSIGRKQNAKFINEANIYRLAAKSELPVAEEFESWIFDEVLPSIRKNGAYATPATIEAIISDPEFGIKLLSTLKEEKQKREIVERQKNELERRNTAMIPKVHFYDTVLEPSNECIDIGQAAKILKLPYGRNTLFRILRQKGIFFKNKNEPKQEYIERGYFKLFEKSIPRTNHPSFIVITVLVTQKGLLFLSKVLCTEIEKRELLTIC